MNIVGEFAQDVGNFFVGMFTPNNAYENSHTSRKMSIGFGVACAVAAVAAHVLGASTAAVATLIAVSASLILGGMTSIPILTVLPLIAMAGFVAANADYSNVVFVYNINPRW